MVPTKLNYFTEVDGVKSVFTFIKQSSSFVLTYCRQEVNGKWSYRAYMPGTDYAKYEKINNALSNFS